MILLDANILIYAHVNSLPQSAKIRAWLDEQLNQPVRVGFPWASILAFLRLVTNPRVFEHPQPMVDAWRAVENWLSCDNTWTPVPTERHAEVLTKFIALPGLQGNLVPDAHLAALAVEHGLTLCTTDGDFARFPGLRWFNPLVG